MIENGGKIFMGLVSSRKFDQQNVTRSTKTGLICTSSAMTLKTHNSCQWVGYKHKNFTKERPNIGLCVELCQLIHKGSYGLLNMCNWMCR